jgi:hypothetical protein
MKQIRSFIAITSMVLLCTGFKAVDDILEKLGVQKQAAEYAILNNLLNAEPLKPDCSGDCDGPLSFPKATALQTIITGDKKTAAKELCTYIKEYVESAAFHQSYQQLRESKKPYNEQPRKIDPAFTESLRKAVAEYEGQLKNAKSQMEKNMWGQLVVEFRKQYKEASDPTPLTTAWKEKYPERLDSLVKKQLNFYLAEQATVDFAAQTVLKGKTKYFVKPEYEKKSKVWKAIYRGGKEVNEVVKLFVKDWLKAKSLEKE